MASTQQFRFLVLTQDSQALLSLRESPLLSSYTFDSLENTYTLLGKLRSGSFSGLIMPLALPDISGLDLLRFIRGDSLFSSLIVGLVHEGQSQDSLSSNLTDLEPAFYLKQPLNPIELASHLEKIQFSQKDEVSRPVSALLRLGPIELDLERYEFKLKNRPMQLTPIEFKLLKLFIERKGRIQTREHLLATIWGYTTEVESRTIDTHVRRLREKLQEEASRIQTVRGVGYKLIEDN